MVLAEEESFATSIFERLRRPLKEEFLVTRRNTITGRYLNHTFDILILLRNKKTIGVNVVHGSKVDQLMATLSRWTDFKGKGEIDRLILIVVGGVEQPYKRFIEETARDYEPPLSLIFLRPEPLGSKNLTTVFQELTRLITATSTITRIISELLGSKGA